MTGVYTSPMLAAAGWMDYRGMAWWAWTGEVLLALTIPCMVFRFLRQPPTESSADAPPEHPTAG